MIGWAAACALALAPDAAAMRMMQMDPVGPIPTIGWLGFLDATFVLEAITSLLLAIALGALIAFHPMTARTVDTLEEAELPRVHILYALVGAMVGALVLHYGMVIGFVVFGLGGLMRFRSETGSTRATGRLIITTLLGLIAGLNLPHFAVIAAALAWVLIWIFDSYPICRVEIKQLPTGRVDEAMSAYRETLKRAGCKVLSEKKSLSKHRAEFVFRLPRETTQERVHAALCGEPAEALRGEIDWEVE
jgi:hypothetical protein